MSSEVGSHVDPIELIEYARGSLSRSAARGVRDHCTTCVECGDQLAAILLLRERAETRPATPLWRPVAAAAVMVMVLGLGGVWLAGAPDSLGPESNAELVEGSSAPVAPDETVPSGVPWSPRHESYFTIAVSDFLGDRAATAPTAEGGLGRSAPAIRRALAGGRRAEAADLAGDPTVDDRLAGLALYMNGRVEQARRRLARVVVPPVPDTFLDVPPLDRFATAALAGALAELGDKAELRALLERWTPAERTDLLESGFDRLREFAGE